MKIIDISLPLRAHSLSWPGKAPFALESVRSLSRGDAFTSNIVRMDIHLGTHIDAPSHFISDGSTIDEIPPFKTMGPCRVIEFADPREPEIPAQIMEGQHGVERVLFKTRNSDLLFRPEFDPQYVALSEPLARLLVETGVCLVGIDYFSVDRFESTDRAVHHILLGSGVLILEGLNLREVEPGDYQLIALPLNMAGAEGSPVRAVLVRDGSA
jgi:arylformamidase